MGRVVADTPTSHLKLEVEVDLADWLLLHLLELTDRTGLTPEQVAVIALVDYLAKH